MLEKNFQDNFSKIPGMPIAYWVSENLIRAFKIGMSIEQISNGSASGHKTADNDKYIRFWSEVNNTNKKWKPCSTGSTA